MRDEFASSEASTTQINNFLSEKMKILVSPLVIYYIRGLISYIFSYFFQKMQRLFLVLIKYTELLLCFYTDFHSSIFLFFLTTSYYYFY